MMLLPLQVTPFPVNPVLQAQLYDPILLEHKAFESQACVPSKHSLISEGK